MVSKSRTWLHVAASKRSSKVSENGWCHLATRLTLRVLRRRVKVKEMSDHYKLSQSLDSRASGRQPDETAGDGKASGIISGHCDMWARFWALTHTPSPPPPPPPFEHFSRLAFIFVDGWAVSLADKRLCNLGIRLDWISRWTWRYFAPEFAYNHVISR